MKVNAKSIAIQDVILFNDQIFIKQADLNVAIGKYRTFLQVDENYTQTIFYKGVSIVVGARVYKIDRKITQDFLKRKVVTVWNKLVEYGLTPYDLGKMRDVIGSGREWPFTGISYEEFYALCK